MKSFVLNMPDTALNIKVADNFFTRFRGLMFKKYMPSDEGVLIKPCNQIHMFNMRFCIDVIYVSKDNRIVRIDKSVNPGVICKTEKQAYYVIELNDGTADKSGFAVGDILDIKD